MKIADFKVRFLLLSKEQQETTILEMSKATETKDYLKGISKDKHYETSIIFEALIQWCINHIKC